MGPEQASRPDSVRPKQCVGKLDDSSLGQLVLADDTAFTTNVMRLDFIDFDPGVDQELRDLNGTRGVLDEDDARVRNNRIIVLPRIRCQPTAVEFAKLLKWIFSGTPTGSGTVSYPLANTAFLQSIWYLPNNGVQWQTLNVAVDNATIRCSSGEPVEVSLDCVGQTFANPSSGFPSASLDISTQPFIMSDTSGAITVASVTENIREITIGIQNGIDRSRFLNSLTLTATNKLRRRINWSIEEPAGDYGTNWNTALTAGATMSAVFTQPSPATAVLNISSNAVRFEPRNPSVPFQNESFQRLEGKAYRDSSLDPPIAVTLHT